MPKRYLFFVLKSLEFLNSSTLNQIPYEVVECLNHAMNDWVPSDEFIIVTSLINNVEGFSFDSSITFEDNLYKDIETRYNIIFEQRLVQINLPRAFARDYLTAVVQYHELGHFIEEKFRLMEILVTELADNIFNGSCSQSQLDDIKFYFPHLSTYINLSPKPHWQTHIDHFVTTLFHFREYYCDLFAAQYIGNGAKLYVRYLTSDSSNSSQSHPAQTLRAKVVDDYLLKSSNTIIELINSTTSKVCGTNLQQRFEEVLTDDFIKLVPVVINNPKQLHGVIIAAWDLWLKQRNKLSDQINDIENSQIYSVINNLVEKAIGNFITVNEWNKSYSKIFSVSILSKPKDPNVFDILFKSSKGILGKKDIVELLGSDQMYIRPLLDPLQIGEISIDFRLGYDFLVSIQGREAFINASKNGVEEGWFQSDISQFFQSTRRQIGETFVLHPHQTVLSVSLEYVKLPADCMLQLAMRSSYARLGITVNTIVQPGYTGCLNIELTNNSSNAINLTVGSRIIQAIIQRVSQPGNYFHTNRKYACQVRPEPSAVINDTDLTVLNQLWKDNNNR